MLEQPAEHDPVQAAAYYNHFLQGQCLVIQRQPQCQRPALSRPPSSDYTNTQFYLVQEIKLPIFTANHASS